MKVILKPLVVRIVYGACGLGLLAGATQTDLAHVGRPAATMAEPIQALQQEPEQAPEQGLPDGQYCARIAHDNGPMHACDCHRTCYMDDSDPPQEHMQEDPHCKTFCRASQCRCGIEDKCEVPKRDHQAR
jgi:hypothetical protein